MGKTKGRKRKRIWIPLLSIAIVILFLIIYVYPSVTGVLEATSTLEYDALQVVSDVDIYFVRDETVYYASRSGEINYYIDESQLVRKNTDILKIVRGGGSESEKKWDGLLNRVAGFNLGNSLFSNDLKQVNAEIDRLNEELAVENSRKNPSAETIEEMQTQIARLEQKKAYILSADDSARLELDAQSMPIGSYGQAPTSYTSPYDAIVSYYIDGYETEFTPKNMRLLDRKKVEKLDLTNSVQNVTRDTTRVNEPLYKTVRNDDWYVLFWVEEGDISKYKKNADVTLRLPKGEVKGSVFDILDNGDSYMVILSFNRYYEEMARLRKVRAEIVCSDYRGLKVQNESIATKDGQAGVYVKDISGEFVFTPVKIIASDGEISLLENSTFNQETSDGSITVKTVNAYDEVLTSGKPDKALNQIVRGESDHNSKSISKESSK